jgi:C_GCAxxG_C_C family probable redox protein
LKRRRKMNSNKRAYRSFDGTGQKKIGRRTFFAQTIGYSSFLTLLAFPGMITEVLAAKGDKSKEEILKELGAKAEKFMPMYMSCSQPTFAALNEQFELKADRAIPALMPFAGGVAGKGETCGAVSGSLLAIGFYFEPVNQKEMGKAGSSMKYAKLFFDRFTKEFGSTRCREVIKNQYGRYLDLNKPEDQKVFMEESKKTGGCLHVVKTGVLIAGDIILENS